MSTVNGEYRSALAFVTQHIASDVLPTYSSRLAEISEIAAKKLQEIGHHLSQKTMPPPFLRISLTENGKQLVQEYLQEIYGYDVAFATSSAHETLHENALGKMLVNGKFYKVTIQKLEEDFLPACCLSHSNAYLPASSHTAFHMTCHKRWEMAKNKELTDLKIIVQNTTLHAHKLELKSSTGLLPELIEKVQGEFVIENKEPGAVFCLLQFIYTANIDDLILTPKEYVQTLLLAEEWQLLGFKFLWQHHLSHQFLNLKSEGKLDEFLTSVLKYTLQTLPHSEKCLEICLDWLDKTPLFPMAAIINQIATPSTIIPMLHICMRRKLSNLAHEFLRCILYMPEFQTMAKEFRKASPSYSLDILEFLEIVFPISSGKAPPKRRHTISSSSPVQAFKIKKKYENQPISSTKIEDN